MTLAAKLRRAPVRIATGAFILNAGIGKLAADDDTAKALHGMASGAYPVLDKVPPKPFLKTVSVAEIVVGGALLTPLVPAGLAGLGLTAFAGSLLGMWWRTPGMHAEGSPKPTQQGTPVAKDVWMLGIGASLIIDAALTESPVTGETARAEAKANTRAHARAARKSAVRAADRAGHAADLARKQARKQAKRARKQAQDLLPS
jgi:hypothetical protein